MKKLLFIITIAAMFVACSKSSSGPSTSSSSEYVKYSITRAWNDKAVWQLCNPAIPIMYDTILNTSYVQVNGGTKIYLPTLSCISDTLETTEPAYVDFTDSLPVNSGDIITICINMKHRWDYDTSWNTWGSWVGLFQYPVPYTYLQYEQAVLNSEPIPYGKGEGLDQGVCMGDTLSQTVTYKIE